MAPKSKVRGPADHEEELADLQRRFDALGELPLPTPAPHGPHTLGTRPVLSRSGVAYLRSVCKAGGRPQPVDADQGDLQA